MKFKWKTLEPQWQKIVQKNPLIKKIVAYYLKFFEEITITSIYRKKKNDTGVHEDWRAVDIRANNLPYNLIVDAVKQINKEFKRIDGKPTAIAHGEGANFHVHIQTPIEGESGIMKKYKPEKTAVKAGETFLSASVVSGLMLYLGASPELTSFLTPTVLAIYKAVVNYIKNK